ncbi:LOW QUALITY PROTEIN: hypothetical protein QTO34_012991 [Cnephaeus nilssonii]|uniref:Tenascin XB n=1 Tax=Cnephaeus nilssonii TaxID=3371016 RepID=A0AA40HA48_CNENI|nr:LOW QUALITY PROTEIN: hypothetical protein QTO34_012991 [Eptesicus nilssonii]
MMPAQCSLASSLALLLLLGTVRAGPFSPPSNMTLPAPRPPPQPGGRTAEPSGGNPSSQLYEHTVEGGEKQVVFTHRINLPPSAVCGCPPGTEPPVPASEVQALRVRLEILEELVKGLKEQCTGGCCPAAAQAGTGQTDVRSLCSRHGVFDLNRCACSCELGWGGPTCSDPTDSQVSPSSPPAASGSCPEDCNDQGRCVRGRCVCFSGYTGPSCGWPSCPGDCQGRGRCVQGVCVCRPGFSGADCSQRSCPRGCSQRGRCENGRCVCNPGYTGEDCAARSCPRGCSQKGRCEDGRCVCDPGYAGEDCGSRTCPGDCGEGGRCVDGRCVCWPGYAGEDCGTRTCPRDCRGRGRCEDGECICDAGYSGDDCGVRSCPGDCNQRGRCEDGRCVCWPGYTGPDCGARACPRDCRGRGRCENGVCVCHAGYSGEDCGVRSCPGDCRGRGRCESGRCVCWPGYTGRDCSLRACPGDCRGRGRCVDGRCVCNPGFTGEDCGSRRCPGDCRGRGRCEDGVCACDVGYEGEDCGARSCPGGCRGRGQCLDGRCVCDDGYSGDDCGSRRCPHDCSQRGVCQDGVCTCWEGFAGEDCGLRTCPSDCHRRGRCEDGRCVCDSGYTGPSCSTRICPDDCRGHGRCVQGACVCHAGYSGEDCGQEEPPAGACPGGCGPRELCRAGQCVCVEGFRGPDCAIQTCPGDCRGRGECREGSCVCLEGYAGEDCGEEVPAIEGMRMHLLEETTVRTEWTRAPGPVDAYEIQFIPTPEGASPPFTARVPSSASAYDQRGLAPGQEYQVTVRALRGTNWGPPASKTITTMIDGPQDLRVVAVTPTTLALSWLRPQAEVDRFVVSYVSAGNQRVRLEVPAGADGTLLTDLMPGVEYVVTVTAERGRAVSYPASVRANTGSAPSGLLGATDEPPPSGPSTTQGAQAPGLQQRPQELGELRVLGRDKTGRLRVAWMAQPDTFAHFQLRLRVPNGPGSHDQLLPGDVRQALLPAPPPGAPYELSLHGVPPEGEPSAPLIYQGIMGSDGEEPGQPLAPPRLGELTATDVTGSSLRLHWTVPEGEFDSFVIQPGPARVVPAEGPQRSALITNLDVGRKYKFVLYGFVGKKRHGPLVAEAKIGPRRDPGPEAPPRLGTLRVTEPTPHSLRLSWTVPEGHFDSFVVQYRDRDGRPQVVPLEGPERSVTVAPLDADHKYRFTLFGIANKKRHGPLSAEGTTAPERREEPHPEPPEQEQPLLGELTVTGATPDSLRLSWTVARGRFASFVIQYKDAQGQPRAVPVPGEESAVTIPGLEPGRKYKMTLYGLHGRQRVGPVSVVAATAAREVEEETPSPTEPSTEAPQPPEEPLLGELTVTGSSPDSLSLSWTVPRGQFDHFLVQYKNGDGQPKAVRVPGHEDGVTISGLEPDHKYKMHLYGFHDGQRQGPASATGVTAAEEETPSPTEPSTEAPEPPQEPLLGELTVTGSSPDSLSLSWTVPRGHFDAFTVQYKDRDGRPQVVRVGGEESEVTVRGLEPGRKYKMHLYGLHGGRRVGPASTLGLTGAPPGAAPAATEPPRGPRLGELTVTGVTPRSVGLAWTVPEGQFDSFVVQYEDRDGQLQAVPVAAAQREVAVPGLEPARRYRMLLYGLHGGQRLGPLSVGAVTAPLPPAPATESPQEPRLGELTVTDVTPNSVGLSWTVPEGEFDSFVVQYKDRDGQPRAVPVAADQREATVPGLEPHRKYKFLLFGIQEGKRRSPVSVEAKTAAPGDASPQAPPRLGELWVTEPSADSLRLSWTVPEGHFDSFVVQFKDRDGPRTVPVGGGERSVTITPLDSDRTYRFLLYGLLGKRRHGPLSADGTTGAQSAASGAGTKRPPKPRLGAELQVTSVTPDSVGLAWTVPEGQFDSFVVQYKDREGRPQVLPVGGGLREATVRGLDAARRYKLLLYGLHQGRRVGPLSALAVTGHRSWGHSPKPSRGGAPARGADRGRGHPAHLHLSWTVTEGQLDSFEVQYTDQDGQLQVVSLGGDQRDITLSGLEADHRYRVSVYGLRGPQRLGPVQVEALTAPRDEEEEPSEPPPTTPEHPVKPRLGELTVTGASPDSLSLSWTVPEGQFDHFLVQYKNGDGQPKAVRVPGHEDGVTISGLEPDHKYKMHLYGFHDGQRQGPASATGVTAAEEETSSPTEPSTEAPEPPQEPLLGELTVTGSSPDSLSLSWTVPRGHFDAFTVQYKDRDGRPQVVRVGGEESEVTVRGLEPGRKYKMHLYGLHGGRRVGPASTLGLTARPAPDYEAVTTQVPPTTTPEPPVKPRLGELTVTGSSPDSLSLSWTVPEGQFDHFLVQYKNGDGQSKAVRVPGHEDGVTISGLEPDHKYKMHLYGFHDGQRQGPASATGVTAAEEETPSPTEPSTEAPEPPQEPLLGELTVTGSSPDSLSLSWTVPRGHFDAFTVQYKDRDGRPQVVRVGGERGHRAGPGAGRKYKMHLYGLHGGRRVGPVSTLGLTGEWQLKGPRVGLRKGLSSGVSESLPVQTITSRPLTHTLSTGQLSTELSTTPSKSLLSTTSMPGPGRLVCVLCLNWLNTTPVEACSTCSMLASLSTRVGVSAALPATGELVCLSSSPRREPPAGPPVKPRLGELTVTGSSPDSLSLSWTVPEGHTRTGTGSPKAVRVPGHEDGVTISGLEPDHKYKMHLYGFHDGQRQGPASATGVTAAEEETPSPTEPSTEAPEPPQEPLLGELTVTGSSPDSLSLSWTVPRGHFDAFTVQYKDRDGRPQVVRVGGEESEVTVRGLEPGRKYKMHLYGLHGGRSRGPRVHPGPDRSSSSRLRSCDHPSPTHHDPEPPVKPRLGELTVTGSSPDSLSLSWTVPEGQFDHFLVQYKNGDGQPKAVRVPGHEDGVTISGLEPDHKYKMHLYGFHDGQRQGPASATGVTAAEEETPSPTEPSTEAPEPPQEPLLGELTVTGSSPDSLSLSWTVPRGHFDAFTVQYKDRDGRPQVVRVGGEESEVTVRGLEPGRKYKMHLYGLHGGRRVGPASTLGLTAALPSEPPVAPRLEGLAVAAVTSDSYRDAQGQPQAVPVGGDLREVTVSGLAPARKYKFLLFGVQDGKRHGPLSADAKTRECGPKATLALEPVAVLRPLLTVTGVTPDSVGLSWTVPQGKFDSFVVQYKDRHGRPRAVPVAADQREATVGGLEPHRKYRFLLYGLAGGKQLGPVSAEGTTAPEEDTPAPWQAATAAPETPGGPRLGELAVTDSTPDSLRLAWTVARGPFDSFVVQYWDADRQPQALLVGGDQDEVRVSGLEPSTPYTFFLYGLHQGKRLGPVSAEGTTGPAPAGRTPGGPGPRLSQLSVTDVTTSSMRLSWEAPPGAFDSFLLRYGPHPRPLLQREVTVPGTRLSAVLRDLRPGTLYSLTLYGLRGPHQADSVQGTARTLSPVLESPRDLQFSEIGETSVKVSWTPPPSRADSFKVSYQLVDGGEPRSVQVGGGARTQQLGGLVPGAHYEVTVVSVRGFERVSRLPASSPRLRALNLTEGSARLHWKPPRAPVDTYALRVTAPGAPPLQASAPGSAVDYPLQGLELHTNYTATVHGLRGPNLTSAASITFTTGLEGPRDLEAKEVTPRTALLTWTEPQVLPTGYLLTYDTPDGQTQEILLPGSATSHQLLGLFPSTTYRAWLRAVWGEGLTPPMSTSFTTGGLQVPFPRDCGEEMQNGAGTSRTTTIFINGDRARPLDVFCDMETDGGGWLVFQRRMDGRTDFWRDWEDYAHGFGNISGEFWLGNEALHSLTSAGDYSMRVDLRAGGEVAFAQYDSFRVNSAADYYRLHLEGYHGTAGDSMSYHSGSVFSARDRDPNNLLISCAVSYRGAWWYRNCHYANLNGLYGSTVDHQGVSWYHWKGFEFSVPFTEMKLRPRGYRAPAGGG